MRLSSKILLIEYKSKMADGGSVTLIVRKLNKVRNLNEKIFYHFEFTITIILSLLHEYLNHI